MTPEQEQELLRRVARIDGRVDFILGVLLFVMAGVLFVAIMKWLGDYSELLPPPLASILGAVIFITLIWVVHRAKNEDK